jgi:tetratricopeptide (TPR) repeat protein
VENGNYQPARRYLIEAEAIDANNAAVVSTKAFIDMMDLIRDNVRANPEALADATYNLSKLNLREDEIHYHIGTVALQEGNLDVSEASFSKIAPAADRFSLRARAHLIGQIYLQDLEGGSQDLGARDEILAKTKTMLPLFIRDVVKFKADRALAANLVEHAYAFGYALIFLLPAQELPTLKEMFAQIHPYDEEFITTLDSQFEVATAGGSSDPEKVLNSLYAAQEKSRKSSPVAEQVNAAINQYSAQIQLDQTSPATEASDYESDRKTAISMRKEGNNAEAMRTFENIVARYQRLNLAPDATLYKTYFDLALLHEYELHDPEQAIAYYEQAEQLAGELRLNDPSIHNTFGYLYYKLGRDARDPDVKRDYLTRAQEKLEAALAINAKYDKSLRTLAAVKTEFEKIRQTAFYQQQIEQMPEQQVRLRR